MIIRIVQPITVALVLSTLTYANEYTIQIAACLHEQCVKEITLQGEKKGFSIESYVREKGGYVVTVGHYPTIISAKKEFRKIKQFKKEAFVRQVDPIWSKYSENAVIIKATLPSSVIPKELPLKEEASISVPKTTVVSVSAALDHPDKPIVPSIHQDVDSDTTKVYRYDCAENRGVTVESNRYKHVVIEYDCYQN